MYDINCDLIKCTGNYRQAHDVLYNTICELRNNKLKVSNEMTANLALLHSYILVRVYVRLDNHSKAAPLLIRVSESIDRFPSRMIMIHNLLFIIQV